MISPLHVPNNSAHRSPASLTLGNLPSMPGSAIVVLPPTLANCASRSEGDARLSHLGWGGHIPRRGLRDQLVPSRLGPPLGFMRERQA